jgi:hypothetical protein
MSDSKSSDREGCAGWFKWLVGTFIALLGALGGLVALLDWGSDPAPPAPSTPIVITINTENGNTGNGTDTPQQTSVELPEDVFVPEFVPTPISIVNEPNSNRPSEQDVADFLYEAVLAETAAYLYLDSSYLSWYFTGEPLATMQSELAGLLNAGTLVAKLYDESQSYIYDINFVDDYRIEVDSCETWSLEYYNLWDSSFLGGEGPNLYPQTIVIEQFSDGWYITDVLFYDAPTFCS